MPNQDINLYFQIIYITNKKTVRTEKTIIFTFFKMNIIFILFNDKKFSKKYTLILGDNVLNNDELYN